MEDLLPVPGKQPQVTGGRPLCVGLLKTCLRRFSVLFSDKVQGMLSIISSRLYPLNSSAFPFHFMSAPAGSSTQSRSGIVFHEEGLELNFFAEVYIVQSDLHHRLEKKYDHSGNDQ